MKVGMKPHCLLQNPEERYATYSADTPMIKRRYSHFKALTLLRSLYLLVLKQGLIPIADVPVAGAF